MATKEQVIKVWIEDGCIVCDACETACPTVFEVTDDSCVIRPEALNVEFTKPLTASIQEAAEECPVDVIKFETVGGGAPAAGAEVAAAAPAAKPSPVAAAEKSAEPQTKSASAAKAPAKAPKVSAAGDPDPAIQALLRAATTRGGAAGVAGSDEAATPALRSLRNKSASELPPDARQAKVMAATKSAKAKDGVSRRGLLASSACGVGWMSVAGTTAVSGLAFQRFMMPNVSEEEDPNVRIAPLEVYATMPIGSVNNSTKPLGFWIIRLEDRIAALNIICTHLGCIPSWLPNDRKFKCPCHGSGFRPNGINFEGPAPRPLERFRISVLDGLVVVDRSKKFQYEKGEWDNPECFVEV